MFSTLHTLFSRLGRSGLLLASAALAVACSTPGNPSCDSPYRASPQFKDCGFRNMDNPAALPSQSTLKIFWRMFTVPKVGTVPVDPIPMLPLDRAQLEALDGQQNHVVRLGHSSHLLKLQGQYWLIDPVFSERTSPVQWYGPKRFHPNPIALADLPPITGVVLSHDHYDHLDSATIDFLKTGVQHFLVPLGVGPRLVGMGVAAERITEMDWWQSQQVGPLRFTAAPAQHFSGRTLSDRNSTLWASWVVQSGGQRIYYSGDSGYFPGFAQIGERLGGFDLALMENGAYDPYWPAVHMTPEHTLQAFQDLRAQTLYSVHNSTFDLAYHPWQEPLERLTTLAQQQQIDLATPLIGEVLTVGQPRQNRLWWRGMR